MTACLARSPNKTHLRQGRLRTAESMEIFKISARAGKALIGTDAIENRLVYSLGSTGSLSNAGAPNAHTRAPHWVRHPNNALLRLASRFRMAKGNRRRGESCRAL